VIRAVKCPWCDDLFHCTKFVSPTMWVSPCCERAILASWTGMSWESADITVVRPYNGHWAVRFVPVQVAASDSPTPAACPEGKLGV
jgi:hypothetical protein